MQDLRSYAPEGEAVPELGFPPSLGVALALHAGAYIINVRTDVPIELTVYNRLFRKGGDHRIHCASGSRGRGIRVP